MPEISRRNRRRDRAAASLGKYCSTTADSYAIAYSSGNINNVAFGEFPIDSIACSNVCFSAAKPDTDSIAIGTSCGQNSLV